MKNTKHLRAFTLLSRFTVTRSAAQLLTLQTELALSTSLLHQTFKSWFLLPAVLCRATTPAMDRRSIPTKRTDFVYCVTTVLCMIINLTTWMHSSSSNTLWATVNESDIQYSSAYCIRGCIPGAHFLTLEIVDTVILHACIPSPLIALNSAVGAI